MLTEKFTDFGDNDMLKYTDRNVDYYINSH